MSWCRAPSGPLGQIFVNCLTATVLSYSRALSDERSGLSFVSRSLKSFSIYTYIFFHFAYLTYAIQIHYIQALRQSRPGTADYAPLVVAKATTAV
jgi:hypothetical protein